MYTYTLLLLQFVELREEVREAETLLQARVKERDILKGFKVSVYIRVCVCCYTAPYCGCLCGVGAGEGVYG